MKKFITAFVVKMGFLVFLSHGLASEDPSCRLEFLSLDDKSSVEFVDILPLSANDSTAIRNKLDVSQNTGAATLVLEQPLNPEMAMKLHNFLIMHPEIYLRDLRKGGYPVPRSSKDHWKNQLSKDFSKVEINQIEEELERYFDQIAKTILNVDNKVVELNYSSIKTEQNWSPKEHDHDPIGGGFSGFGWISTTHAIFGPGTWYETIHNGKLKKTNTKTAETLLLSESYRNRHTISGENLFSLYKTASCISKGSLTWRSRHYFRKSDLS